MDTLYTNVLYKIYKARHYK